MFLLSQKPFLKESVVSFNPSVEEIVCGFDNTVDSLVISVQQMARIETFLFQVMCYKSMPFMFPNKLDKWKGKDTSFFQPSLNCIICKTCIFLIPAHFVTDHI